MFHRFTRIASMSPVHAATAAATFALLLAGSASAAQTQICHVPPGNPSNFHTITVGGKAADAHLAHGDLLGPCNDHCATLCDDGNACTIDDNGTCEQTGCAAERPQVNCDDGNACTADACDAASGCTATPTAGAACDDGEPCTEYDQCDADGQCVAGADTCGANCPEGTQTFEGMCYVMADLSQAPIVRGPDGRINAWLIAESYCAATWGGHLATIHSTAQNQFVGGLLAAASPTGSTGGMIGATDQLRPVNNYGWLDGSIFDYSNWAPGEPSNRYTSRGTEDCAQMVNASNANGPMWNDVPCTDGGPSVCMFAP